LVVKIPGTDPGMTVAAELVDAESLDEKLVMVEERENVDEAELGQLCCYGHAGRGSSDLW
jgi:hypothetical protein